MNTYSENSLEVAAFQPVLCLRGGGADAKRKEARKRKFANGQDGKAAPLLTEGVESARKKARKQTPTSSGEEVVPTSEKDATEARAVKEAEAESSSIAQRRSQRFIVFIGR